MKKITLRIVLPGWSFKRIKFSLKTCLLRALRGPASFREKKNDSDVKSVISSVFVNRL